MKRQYIRQHNLNSRSICSRYQLSNLPSLMKTELKGSRKKLVSGVDLVLRLFFISEVRNIHQMSCNTYTLVWEHLTVSHSLQQTQSLRCQTWKKFMFLLNVAFSGNVASSHPLLLFFFLFCLSFFDTYSTCSGKLTK